MKLKLIFVLFVFILFGCSVSEAPEMRNLNGNWKIYVGGEYSQIAKNIELELSDTAILYDGILLDSLHIEECNLKAVKHFTKDSIFRLDINLTFEIDRIWGYEITEHLNKIDSTYIYGERIQP